MIEAEEGGPSALPVLRRGEEDRGVETSPDVRSPFPVLESIHIGVLEDVGVDPLPRSYPSAQLASYLILRGTNFTGDTVDVEFRHSRLSEPNHPQFLAPQKIPVPPGDRTANEIRLIIPNDADAQTKARIGPYTVSVIVSSGGKARVTNALPLLLAPRISDISPNPAIRDGSGNVTLTLKVSPKVLPTDTVSLLLVDRETPAQPHAADTDTLQVIVTHAPIVTHATVRLRVNGVDSLPFERKFEPGKPPHLEIADSQKVTIA